MGNWVAQRVRKEQLCAFGEEAASSSGGRGEQKKEFGIITGRLLEWGGEPSRRFQAGQWWRLRGGRGTVKGFCELLENFTAGSGDPGERSDAEML